MIFLRIGVKLKAMKFTELKNDITEGARSIYLLEGDDAYFRMKGEELIKSAFVSLPELNFAAFEGEALKGAALSSLVAALESFPFMSEKRVIKVTGFYPTESEYENYLKKTFDNFPPTSVLIIVNSESRNGADLKRKHAVTFVDCNRADEETVAKWAYFTLRRSGISAPVDACAAIARYCLCNMSRVALEVEKLTDYKISGELTMQEVEELVYKDADYRIYEMTNAVARGDFDKYCAAQAELVRKNGDETGVLSGLFSYFRNALTILTSQCSDAELSKLLKMKEYGVKKSREQARAIGEEKLKLFVSCIYSAVSDIKSGLVSPQNALQNVNNAIFFTNAGNKAL